MNRLISEIFPLVVFILGYQIFGIYKAVAILIVASFLQALFFVKINKFLGKIYLINLIALTVFGSATMWFETDIFIKIKPTVIYWSYSIFALLGNIFFKKNVTRYLFESKFKLEDFIWKRINVHCIIFLFLMGCINLYIAFSGKFTEAQWVVFKVFYSVCIITIFFLLQIIWIYIKSSESFRSTFFKNRKYE